ncbi:MAG: hypothetical protein DMG32_18710 [Acidobacteria bacterium]|nr:MAG: hypothetical protein DMG32_18710 [Acidobacteriota bacterium]
MFRQVEKRRQDELEEQRLRLEQGRLEREVALRDVQLKKEQLDLERRAEMDERNIEEERQARWEASEREERGAVASSAGMGSGGYIVIEMSEKDRPLFHDLLKGFEDYAKLKGYYLSFSMDSSFEGKIAFKFTVQNDGVVVGPARVRQDFRDYLKQVQNEDINQLDNLPVITTIEEHNLLVALLKNRISFLQHSYQLSQNAVNYYEGLLMNMRSFPALPTASVVVQTGGTMDSRRYKAVDSSHLIQGDQNSLADSSLNIEIGRSFNEKQALSHNSMS